MSSQECKDAIVEYFDDQGIATNDADWKRVSKHMVNGYGGQEAFRYFEHTSGSFSAYTLGDDEDEITVFEGGKLLYDVGNDPNMAAYGGGDYFFVCPEGYWARNQDIPSIDHHEYILPHVTGLSHTWFSDEMQENSFALPQGKSMADLHREFQAAGMEMRPMALQIGPQSGPGSPNYGQVTGNSIPPGYIVKGMVELIEANDPCVVQNGEVELDRVIAEVISKYNCNGAESAAIAADLLMLLDEYGVDPTAIYAAGDLANLTQRLKSAAADPHGHQRPGKLSSGKFQKDDRPDADLTGLDMHAIYRLVLRGEVPQIAAIGWCWDDPDDQGKRQGMATEDELAFYCGYLDRDYKLIRNLYIPDDVYARILPEYAKMTWNDYEPKDESNYHTMPMPDEAYVEGVRSIIHGRFLDRGFRLDEAMLAAPPAPLTPLRTNPSYTGYPMGMTGAPISPHAAQQNAMMAQIAQTLGQLGATGGAMVGNQTLVSASQVAAAMRPQAPAPASLPAGTTEDQIYEHFRTNGSATINGRTYVSVAFSIGCGAPGSVGFRAGYVDNRGEFADQVGLPPEYLASILPGHMAVVTRINGNASAHNLLVQSAHGTAMATAQSLRQDLLANGLFEVDVEGEVTAHPTGQLPPFAHLNKASPQAAQPATTAQAQTEPFMPVVDEIPRISDEDMWAAYQRGSDLSPWEVAKAAFTFVVEEGPYVSFLCGYVDPAGGLLDYQIPEAEISKLFAEYQVDKPVSTQGTYRVRKLFGQGLDELKAIISERLKGAAIVDMSA